MMSFLHPERPDIYVVAAHDLVGDNEVAMAPPTYDFYDAGCFAQICGLQHEAGMIVAVDGLERVEAMPGFVRWYLPPRVGTWVSPTVDLATFAYFAVFRHDGDVDLTLAIQEEVLDTVRITVDPAPKRWSGLRLADSVARARRKAAWLAHRRARTP